MIFNILITKETRAGESRVALIPSDVRSLINQQHKIFVEHDAGKGAGFSDEDYQNAGAVIRYLDDDSLNAYKDFFKDINLIVRVKRPQRSREVLENQAINSGTAMIGALDPLEKNSPHMDEYHRAGIIPHSIDQLTLDVNDPMNILAAMSKIAGQLALLDAIKKFDSVINKIVIIGFGIVGQAAFDEAIKQKLPTTIILSRIDQANEIKKRGGQVVILQRQDDLKRQQEIVKNAVLDANIVISSARRANQLAPLLIPMNTLQQMQKGTVIVDMALSEGGNVEGSAHDATHHLGNGIIVTNTSGYPKAVPHEASRLWSTASLHFIKNNLEEGKI